MLQSRDVQPRVPDGWQPVFDNDYHTWYYVNLSTQQSQWDEPRGTIWPRTERGPPPPMGPPSGAPRGTYDYSYDANVPRRQREPEPIYHQDHIQLPPVVQQTVYQQPVLQQPMVQQQPVYQQAPMQPSVVVEQKTVEKERSGISKGLLGAGVGLVGGALIASAIDGHHHHHHHDGDYYNDYDGDRGYGYGGGNNTTMVENNYYQEENNHNNKEENYYDDDDGDGRDGDDFSNLNDDW